MKIKICVSCGHPFPGTNTMCNTCGYYESSLNPKYVINPQMNEFDWTNSMRAEKEKPGFFKSHLFKSGLFSVGMALILVGGIGLMQTTYSPIGCSFVGFFTGFIPLYVRFVNNDEK